MMTGWISVPVTFIGLKLYEVKAQGSLSFVEMGRTGLLFYPVVSLCVSMWDESWKCYLSAIFLFLTKMYHLFLQLGLVSSMSPSLSVTLLSQITTA